MKLLFLSVLLFALICEWIFIKTHSIEIRFVTELENVLFAGVCVHFQPGHFTGWGSERLLVDQIRNLFKNDTRLTRNIGPKSIGSQRTIIDMKAIVGLNHLSEDGLSD